MKRLSICSGLIALVVQASIASKAISAEIKSVSTNSGRILILLTGEIVPGDADAFTAIVKEANNARKFVANVRLNSEGGNLLEGVKLADAVRFGKISTNVGRNATCASACFLVFAAGVTKFASYTARIGVHGASDQSGEETVASEAATVSMAKVARELGVPAAIIGRMVVTPPAEMVWLAPQDLQSMGTTMVGKPSQVATSAAPEELPAPQTRETTATGPLSLQPQARASAPPPTWAEFVKAAAARSAAQNNGVPAYVRSCEPKLKVCHSGVMFLEQGNKEMLLNVTRDINDRLVSREVCEFNETADVRKCFDWDTGAKHSDMKDNNGNWYKVE